MLYSRLKRQRSTGGGVDLTPILIDIQKPDYIFRERSVGYLTTNKKLPAKQASIYRLIDIYREEDL
jgi:hypothetical protein